MQMNHILLSPSLVDSQLEREGVVSEWVHDVLLLRSPQLEKHDDDQSRGDWWVAVRVIRRPRAHNHQLQLKEGDKREGGREGGRGRSEVGGDRLLTSSAQSAARRRRCLQIESADRLIGRVAAVSSCCERECFYLCHGTPGFLLGGSAHIAAP
jgi:hypothetical protein